MKKQKALRSKSVSVLGNASKNLDENCNNNLYWANMLKDTTNLIPKKNLSYTSFYQVLKRVHQGLTKQANSWKNSTENFRQCYERIENFAEQKCSGNSINSIEYFLSQLQEKQNEAEYYQNKLDQFINQNQLKQYEEELQAKVNKMKAMAIETENAVTNKKNKLQKIQSELKKGREFLEASRNKLFLNEIKLRKLENLNL